MGVAYSEPRSEQITDLSKQADLYIVGMCISPVLVLLQCEIPEFGALSRSYPESLARLEFKVFGGHAFLNSCIRASINLELIIYLLKAI